MQVTMLTRKNQSRNEITLADPSTQQNIRICAGDKDCQPTVEAAPNGGYLKSPVHNAW